jgi:hypothetical protein
MQIALCLMSYTVLGEFEFEQLRIHFCLYSGETAGRGGSQEARKNAVVRKEILYGDTFSFGHWASRGSLRSWCCLMILGRF